MTHVQLPHHSGVSLELSIYFLFIQAAYNVCQWLQTFHKYCTTRSNVWNEWQCSNPSVIFLLPFFIYNLFNRELITPDYYPFLSSSPILKSLTCFARKEWRPVQDAPSSHCLDLTPGQKQLLEYQHHLCQDQQWSATRVQPKFIFRKELFQRVWYFQKQITFTWSHEMIQLLWASEELHWAFQMFSCQMGLCFTFE